MTSASSKADPMQILREEWCRITITSCWEGVSREHGVYLALHRRGRGKAIRSYRLSEGYMPVDIDRRIASQKDRHEKKNCPQAEIKNPDWAMSRNYQLIPYGEMSEYQKIMVRQVLEARRLYRRTGTPLYMHERSVGVLQKMKNETRKCGIYVKRKEARRVLEGVDTSDEAKEE